MAPLRLHRLTLHSKFKYSRVGDTLLLKDQK